MQRTQFADCCYCTTLVQYAPLQPFVPVQEKEEMKKDLTQKVTGLTEERKVYQERCIALEKQLAALRRQVHLCCCRTPLPTCQRHLY